MDTTFELVDKYNGKQRMDITFELVEKLLMETNNASNC